MSADISLLATASLKARHAAARQALVAENVANADTPGFRARDLEPFDKALARAAQGTAAFRHRTVEEFGLAEPNGNAVDLERELARGAEASRDHDIAMTIYAKAVSMLRATLGRKA